MAILKYNFEQYNKVINLYLEVVKDNSEQHLVKQAEEKKISNPRNDIIGLDKSLGYLQDYLYYYFLNYPDKFSEILSSVISNIKTIGVLPDNKRGIYGEAVNDEKIIYINPSLASNGLLTGDDRTRLYMAHEIGHIINNRWMKNCLDSLNEMLKEGVLSKEEAERIYEGMSLIDEVTTQDRAEDITYYFKNINRPSLKEVYNPRLFKGESFKSNFDFYGELLEPGIMFARTLRGIGSIESDSKALSTLSERALSSDFFDNILYEYNRDGHTRDLLEVLKYMGNIKRASYATFGYDDLSYLSSSKENKDKLIRITSSLRDYREEFGPVIK